MTASWQPSATVELLKVRAKALHSIRAFFFERSVMEVDVPVMGLRAVSDPFVAALKCGSVEKNSADYYLQTSPEYFMKRLLSAGAPDIFYLGKSFRDDQPTLKHNPEFTMLEWYRIGMSPRALIDEVFQLVSWVQMGLQEFGPINPLALTCVSYGEIFNSATGMNPHQSTSVELANYAHQKMDLNFPEASKSFWLDLIFCECIEPNLAGIVCIYDYPKEQCALARVEKNAAGEEVASRFEFFVNGVELANGYHELNDETILRKRFSGDNLEREQHGLPVMSLDEKFLAAMKEGCPDCAGVALGVDRLLMGLLGEKSIEAVMPFSHSHL